MTFQASVPDEPRCPGCRGDRLIEWCPVPEAVAVLRLRLVDELIEALTAQGDQRRKGAGQVQKIDW